MNKTKNNLTKEHMFYIVDYKSSLTNGGRILMSPDIKHKKIIDIVEDKLTCSAHNLDHVFRVYNLCLLISKYEKDVDLEVLIPAALLHDIARVEESTDKTGRIDHSVLGSEIAEDILRKLEYEEEKIEKINIIICKLMI